MTSSIQYQKDQHNIVHLILDRKDSSANLIDQQFTDDFAAVTAQLKADDFIGVIIRSTKSTFVAGADLDLLVNAGPDDTQAIFNMVESIKHSMRILETAPQPVVACINGAALGGGWEVALCANYRISLGKSIKLGLPEVTLGLLPGAGGVNRMTRHLGLQAAMPYLTQGKQYNAEHGQQLGLIDEVVDNSDALLANAISWIKTNPEVQQPWDKKGFKFPGGKPDHPAMAQMLPIVPAITRQQSKGVMPAPEAIICAMIEGAQVDFDTACRIESRYFTGLACGQVSSNMVRAFWHQLNAIKAGSSRPQGIDKTRFKKVGILGAGMMGAGIAYACATRGIEVVLKDTSLENANKGKAYSEKILAKKVAKQRLSQDKMNATLGLITPSENTADLAGCEMVIEAVFEDRELKAKVTQEALAVLSETAIFASNTSTIPITGLAQASDKPEQFIGLHFFSPVDKMPLVEIIRGAKTNDQTLAAAYDFVQQITKTPIVVNDSRGFFTSRVFSTYTLEGLAMLDEGIDASSIENAAFLSGFPVGPLAVTDEVTITLFDKIRKQEQLDAKAEGKPYISHPGFAMVDKMLAQERQGKFCGKGFYDYPEQGKKHLWDGLKDYQKPQAQTPDQQLQDLKDRLLYIQAIESARCYQEQVLTSVGDANIGSIMGIGFPAWTGGVLQFINAVGVDQFVQRAEQLAQQYGERFSPPALLKDMAAKAESFNDN